MNFTPALKVKRVPHSEDLLHPGDYVFVGKRAPIRRFESIPIDCPREKPDGTVIGDAFRFWKWKWFGKKYEIKQIVELLWPEIDTVILNCPVCNSPCATTRNHRIVSIEPLTIETPITCPYCRTNTFKVAEGNIMTA